MDRPDRLDDLTIRPLATPDDRRACLEIQRATWGEQFDELVSPIILMIAEKIGGVAAGAFDARGRMLGFVFGLSGVRDGELVHWSDMLAVREEARDLGLGRRLKEYQAERVRALGVKRMFWTFDPLVARNAHLNLNRLGARPVEYVVDMYEDTESDLHRGFGTDRFVVAWELDPALRAPSIPVRADDAPVVNDLSDLPDAPLLRVEIPRDVQTLKADAPDEAVRWRRTTRRAFTAALGAGYRVAGFEREAEDGRAFFVLSREGA